MTPKRTVGTVRERYALNQLKAQGRADSSACLAWRRLHRQADDRSASDRRSPTREIASGRQNAIELLGRKTLLPQPNT